MLHCVNFIIDFGDVLKWSDFVWEAPHHGTRGDDGQGLAHLVLAPVAWSGGPPGVHTMIQRAQTCILVALQKHHHNSKNRHRASGKEWHFVRERKTGREKMMGLRHSGPPPLGRSLEAHPSWAGSGHSAVGPTLWGPLPPWPTFLGTLSPSAPLLSNLTLNTFFFLAVPLCFLGGDGGTQDVVGHQEVTGQIGRDAQWPKQVWPEAVKQR